jgi:hypothetical protein
MAYSLKTGIWKTLKNGLIVLGPSIIAFVAALPADVQIKYAAPLGFLLYFIKNYIENRTSAKK